jgi:hypothetical protein
VNSELLFVVYTREHVIRFYEAYYEWAFESDGYTSETVRGGAWSVEDGVLISDQHTSPMITECQEAYKAYLARLILEDDRERAQGGRAEG